jgi:hypothetical protein
MVVPIHGYIENQLIIYLVSYQVNKLPDLSGIRKKDQGNLRHDTFP